LIEAALAGEEVVIAKGDKPVVRLVAIPQGQFKLGVLKRGALGRGPDFFSSMDEDELAAWEGRD
jgi:antitoxin (DNA-binding transcriptional repressor) of toxin-antitoxin stability system